MPTWVTPAFQRLAEKEEPRIKKQNKQHHQKIICNQRCRRKESAEMGVMDAKKVKRFKKEIMIHGFE